MTETGDEDRMIAEGFGPVLAELDWYDGPRGGLAEIDGQVHYFQCHDYVGDVEGAQYSVWPASDDTVAMEREQRMIYVRWRRRRETGEAGPHPGGGGVDARYDELEVLLTPHRQEPADARQLVAEWRSGTGARSQDEGIDAWVRWKPSK